MLGLIQGYRVSRKLYKNGHTRIAKKIMTFYNLLHSASIYSETEIGDGLSFGHGGIGVVIHQKTRIGVNCRIMQHVTIGGKDEYSGVPIIGDNVFIGVGACVLGGVTIGDNVKIGANAVVLDSIPSNSTVVGIPAYIVNTK